MLVRLLRRRRITRPAIRVVPTIVTRTARILGTRAASGRPVTRRAAARVLAGQTRRVLSSPRRTAGALRRNVRATGALRRTAGGAAAGTRYPTRRANGRRRPVYR